MPDRKRSGATTKKTKAATRSAAVKAQPMIAVRDVAKSSRWYQRLLGCESGHGGDRYEQLVSDGTLVLQLHAWDADPHEHMGDPRLKSRGNGVLLWFEVRDFDAAVARARKLKARMLEKPHVNPFAGHREVWIRDPDGYVVVLAG